jgi:head-tail adaptor
MIPSGKRDKFVTIQQRTEAVDDSGFPYPTWSTLATAYMHRRDSSGREKFAADQIAAVGDRVWSMLYQEDMDPDKYDIAKTRRLVYQGWAFDIVHAETVDEVSGPGIVLATSGRKDPEQP